MTPRRKRQRKVLDPPSTGWIKPGQRPKETQPIAKAKETELNTTVTMPTVTNRRRSAPSDRGLHGRLAVQKQLPTSPAMVVRRRNGRTTVVGLKPYKLEKSAPTRGENDVLARVIIKGSRVTWLDDRGTRRHGRVKWVSRSGMAKIGKFFYKISVSQSRNTPAFGKIVTS